MRRAGDRGMTFIDVLVALGLITMGGAGFMAMQLIVLRANEAARQLSDATNLARVHMEQLLYQTATPAAGSERVDGYGCVSGRGCTQRGLVFTRTWTVVAGAQTRVQVRVSWADAAGTPHRVVLDGLR